jgi:hypothetical protein
MDTRGHDEREKMLSTVVGRTWKESGHGTAVVNAVVDALRPFGVRHLDMPLKPERVWRALGTARRS